MTKTFTKGDYVITKSGQVALVMAGIDGGGSPTTFVLCMEDTYHPDTAQIVLATIETIIGKVEIPERLIKIHEATFGA